MLAGELGAEAFPAPPDVIADDYPAARAWLDASPLSGARYVLTVAPWSLEIALLRGDEPPRLRWRALQASPCTVH